MNTKAKLLKTLIKEEIKKQLRNRSLNEAEDSFMYSGKSGAKYRQRNDPEYDTDFDIYPDNPENGMFKGLKALGRRNLMKLKRSLNIVTDLFPQSVWGTNSTGGIRFEAPTGNPRDDWGSNPNIIFYMPDLDHIYDDWRDNMAKVEADANIDFGSVKSYYDGAPRSQQFFVTDKSRYKGGGSEYLYPVVYFEDVIDDAIKYTPLP